MRIVSSHCYIALPLIIVASFSGSHRNFSFHIFLFQRCPFKYGVGSASKPCNFVLYKGQWRRGDKVNIKLSLNVNAPQTRLKEILMVLRLLFSYYGKKPCIDKRVAENLFSFPMLATKTRSGEGRASQFSLLQKCLFVNMWLQFSTFGTEMLLPLWWAFPGSWRYLKPSFQWTICRNSKVHHDSPLHTSPMIPCVLCMDEKLLVSRVVLSMVPARLAFL